MAHHRRHETAPWPVAATLILVLTATCVIPKAEAETTSATPPATTADTTKTTSPPTLEQPTNVTIVNVTTTTITVTWKDPNGPFDKIRVDCSPTNGGEPNTASVGPGILSATCEGLTPGSHYNVNVSSVLSDGSAPPASAPLKDAVTDMNPPTVVIIGNITTTSITVTWTNPIGNFDTIRVDCNTTKGDKNNTQHVTDNSTTATCVNLTPGAQYLVTVSSLLNDSSEPPVPADPVNAVTDPRPPRSVAVYNTTVDSIAVTWALPQGLNDGFKTVCASANGAAPDTVTVKKDSVVAVCSSLTAGALYTVTVTTLTTYGSDTKEVSADPVQAVTVPMPADIEVDDLNTTALVVTIECEPGTKCTRFEVSIANITQTVNWTGSPQAVAISGLESDTLYEVNVTTISDYGAGLTKRSEKATASNWTRPDIVRNLTAVAAGSRDINVSWLAPTDNPSSAMQYVLLVNDSSGCILRTNFRPSNVTQHPGDDACTKRANESINNSQIEIAYPVSGLTPYTYYTVQVVAVNLANSSAPDTAVVMTDQDFPGVVNASSIKVNSAFDSVNLTWDSPVPENGVITGYSIITCKVSENREETCKTNDTAGPNRTAIVDGLEAVSNYSFQIAASTSVGRGNFSELVYSETRTGVPFAPMVVQANADGPYALRVTWDLPPGARATGETVYYDVLATDPGNTTNTRNVTVTGFDVRTAKIGGLHPYWDYDINVTARTEDVGLNKTYTAPGPASQGRTGETTPGPVVSFTVANQQPDNVCNQLTVQWTPPTAWDSHGVIRSYTVTVTSVDQTDTKITHNYTANSEGGTQTNNFPDVDPNNRSYTAMIQAATSKGLGTAYSQMQPVSTGACKPLNITDATAAKVIGSQTGQTQTSVTVPLSRSFLCNVSNGNLNFRGIIVAAKDMVGEDPHPGVWSPTLDLLNDEYGPWEDGYAAYRTTLTDWNPCDDAGAPQGSRTKRATTNADADKIQYEVGDGDCGSDDYCNKPLAKDSQYSIKLAICTVTGCQVTSYPPIILKTDPSMAWIAAAVIIPVVIIVILIVLFIYLKRDNKWPFNEGTKGGREMQPIASGTDNPAFQDQVTQRQLEAAKEKPPPVHINDFEQHALMRSKDSDLIFAEEYKLIQESSPRHPKDAAEYPQNRIKNRFTNILPFDHSRVKLLPTDDEEGSDYINANYMPGYNSRREYIASQGPMASTQDDFWRMIWEQNVPLIVMLTQLEERGRERCAKYWPSDGEPVYFGDLQVQMRSESVLDTYVIRVFDVRLGAICRTIKQFHYMVWPDFGVPDDQDCLVTFVREVRSHVRPNFQGPLLIHCSAGVGRTGTLIAVDRLLQHICDHNTIDIFGVTMEMREYRCYMVQVEAQYIFIHKCITSAIRRGLHLNRRTTMVEDQPLYANTDMIENGGPIYENATTATVEEAI